MRQFPLLIVLAVIAASSHGYERKIAIHAGGPSAFRGGFEAVVEEPALGFEWIELRPRYSIMLLGQFRDYDDGFGWYSSATALAGAGRADLVGGLFGLDVITGIHFSRLEGGYKFADLVLGLRVASDLTFWKDSEFVSGELAILFGNGFSSGWAQIELRPFERFSVIGGAHYDGELANWGEPLPFQTPESWPDRWDGGVNLFLAIGYRFNLR